MDNNPQLQPPKKGTGVDPVLWHILMQISETIPRLFLFSSRNVRGTHMKEDQVRLVLGIFSFLKRGREKTHNNNLYFVQP